MILREANLFEVDTDAIAHGCNLAGRMGAGVAKQWRQKFPEAYTEYAARCASGHFKLGSYHGFMEAGYIGFNLGTQVFPGAHADASAIGQALASVSHYIHEYQLPLKTIGIPRIGCGIGGLTWDKVEPMILAVESVFPDVEYIVCGLPRKAA